MAGWSAVAGVNRVLTVAGSPNDGGGIELADDAGAELRLRIEWIRILNLVLSPRGTDARRTTQKGSEGVRQIGALWRVPDEFDL